VQYPTSGHPHGDADDHRDRAADDDALPDGDADPHAHTSTDPDALSHADALASHGRARYAAG
jgi:hypothetical protein